MEVDEDTVPKRSNRRRKEIVASDDEEEIIDVVVCESLSNSDVFCMQFPARRREIFKPEVNPRIRYKKNMEMRFTPNTLSGSFDRSKMETYKSESPVKSPPKVEPGQLNDEIFEGRAFKPEAPFQNTLGIIRNGAMYLVPSAGLFEMRRTIKGALTLSGRKDDEALDSDSDAPTSSKQLRVKFTRPETDRQKKRREQSALYREKMIANDHWLSMNVGMIQDNETNFKVHQLFPKDHSGPSTANILNSRELALASIICEQGKQ